MTVLEATNADTQTLRRGRLDAQELVVAELNDDNVPIYVRRWYEPVAVVDLPEAMTDEEVTEWVEANRDHDAFADYDWEIHDERPFLQTIINNRNNFNRFLQGIEQDLLEVDTVGSRAGNQIEEIRDRISEALVDGPGVEINRVERPEDGDS
jgi:hypothetical protein